MVSALVCPHVCGAAVDEQAILGLSCVRSTGRQFRHVVINDIVKRSLSSAQITYILELTGASWTDGKQPDDVKIATWETSRMLA